MATVVLTPTAVADLARLIATQSLPADTVARFKRSIAALEQFPEIGAPLHGRWAAFRFVLGPWRWMLVVYVYDGKLDRVAVVAIHDARAGESATSGA